MKITLMDRSLYFKGLLLLVRKDRLVRDAEGAMMMRIGALFGYEKAFCREVIDSILTNPHVVDEPPYFSRPEIARCFVLDGIRLSLADGEIHDREWDWLAAVVTLHGVDEKWLADLRLQAGAQAAGEAVVALEAERFVWD